MNCDIIIPVWNQMQLTKECIDSIIRHTFSPYRLIVIDNGSQRQTKEYLEELTRNNNILITIIRNETNLGYIKAVNQGLQISYGDYVCLLNNDTKVGEGWVKELINVAQSNPEIGIVTPRNANANRKGKELKGKWIEISFATSFCILIKRKEIQKIGLLDEAYGIGFWEDTDYCQRAKNTGYFCALAKSAYVYHYAHKTFDYIYHGYISIVREIGHIQCTGIRTKTACTIARPDSPACCCYTSFNRTVGIGGANINILSCIRCRRVG